MLGGGEGSGDQDDQDEKEEDDEEQVEEDGEDDDDDKNPEEIPTEFLPIGKTSVGISSAHRHNHHGNHAVKIISPY